MKTKKNLHKIKRQKKRRKAFKNFFYIEKCDIFLENVLGKT